MFLHIFLFILPFFLIISSNSYALPIPSSQKNFHFKPSNLANTHEIPDFRKLNRRQLNECPSTNLDTNIKINVDVVSPLLDDQNVRVTISGIVSPSDKFWVAMVSPSHADVNNCPLNEVLYVETGDISSLPLLCHYPVKAAYLKNDPDFLPCKKSECNKYSDDGKCTMKSCSATLTFHVINIRTNIEFVVFDNGFLTPCILNRTTLPLQFANPNMPLYGHVSSVNSESTSMTVRWVSGSDGAQQLQYDHGKSVASTVSMFTQKDMCGGAAKDFGWHDPGYIHTAVITGLQPTTKYSYKYGSDLAGWSNEIQFQTPPAGGSNELKFLAFGDMGKAPRDDTVEHFIQPGSLSVVAAMKEEVMSNKVDSIFHIGDISYATGFLVEWDYFLHLITPLASRISYMTAIGNHERDYPLSGSVYPTPDSGGECGVPYESYFPMPSSEKDKPWYSIEQGPVHFTVISTEHRFDLLSKQHKWMKKDMANINRTRTPWLIFMGHRPMYTSAAPSLIPNVDPLFVKEVEPLLFKYKVDLALFGHVHNYERTCAVYKKECLSKPFKDENGVDTYDTTNYTAPVQAVIGMAGFSLDKFSEKAEDWSLKRISSFGYARIHATKNELKIEFVNSNSRQVEDSFRIIKD